jgi:hypothetical protein
VPSRFLQGGSKRPQLHPASHHRRSVIFSTEGSKGKQSQLPNSIIPPFHYSTVPIFHHSILRHSSPFFFPQFFKTLYCRA